MVLPTTVRPLSILDEALRLKIAKVTNTLLFSMICSPIIYLYDRPTANNFRNMSFLPVAVSLSLSFISAVAVAVIGVPAEIYLYGSMYAWLELAIFVICIPPVTEVFIPVFYRLGISSSFEYLQLRYNYIVRLIGTTIYILQNVMYIGVVIYAPSVAIASVTNLSLLASILSVGSGGLKAVIWTDVLQGAIVLIGLLITMFSCTEAVGGWGVVWQTNMQSGRIDFGVFDPNPKIRHSFWSVVIGLGFMWMSIFGTSQSQVQRYLCCKTERDARLSILACMCLSALLFILCMVTGFVMFAYFKDCDPILSGQLDSSDQLVPYMVLSVFHGFPGLPGLFIASVFAAALSSVSSGINAMACVTIEDYIRPYVNWSDGTLNKCSKGLVFLYGPVCIGFALVSKYLGGVLQAALSVLGIVGGPLLGVFTLGIVFPCCNSKGAAAGLIAGVVMTSWIFIGSTIYAPRAEYMRFKPRYVHGCPPDSEIRSTVPPILDRPPIADNFYSVSYAYYTAIGFGVTMGVGLIFGLLTNGYQNRTEVNPKLVRPLLDHRILRWLPKKFRKWMWCGVDYDKVNTHSILEMPGKPASMGQRWSSRERVNSMRLGMKMWKQTIDPEKLSPMERAAMKWKTKQFNRSNQIDGHDDESHPEYATFEMPSSTLATTNLMENDVKTGVPSIWL